MLVNFVDKWGSKRWGEETTCAICGFTFVTRVDQRQIYCSKKCKYIGHRNRVLVICIFCGKEFELSKSKHKSAKTGTHCCSRRCKDKSQKLVYGLSESHPAFYGTGKRAYRKKYHTNEFRCYRCGYSEFSCGVDVHHKDGNRENNDLSNLIPLCKCCHAALHNNLWKFEDLGDMVQRDDVTMAS